MSTAFSRTLRSLAADDFRAAMLGLLAATSLLVAWLAWFLLARVTVYEISTTAHLVSGTQVAAEFPATALGRIQPGQPAHLRLAGFPADQYGSIPATITQVTYRAEDGQVHTLLALQPAPDSPIPLQQGMAGTIEVEIEQVAPATLALRAAGRAAGGNGAGQEGGDGR